MSDIKGLIERLEEATEADRGLDCAIDTIDRGRPRNLTGMTPHFTSSIDAALTLVPDGWQINLRFPPAHGNGCFCELAHYDHMPLGMQPDIGKWLHRVNAGRQPSQSVSPPSRQGAPK